MCKRHYILILILAAISTPAMAEEKPWQNDLTDKRVQMICASFDSLSVPAADQPAPADKARLKNCDSLALYDQAAKPQDYTDARLCALLESEKGDDTGFGTLMMIYANGNGAAKDYKIATKMACNYGGAVMELEGRVKHIEALAKKLPNQPLDACVKEPKLPADYCNGKFDICDDITSGMMQGICERRGSDNAEIGKKAEMDKITATWPPAHQQSFAALDQSAMTYFTKHATMEIQTGGTDNAAVAVAEEDLFKDKYRDRIKHFERGDYPTANPSDPLAAYSDSAYKAADQELNIAYKEAIKRVLHPEFGEPVISKDDVKKTETAWLAYRDAWVAFAALHYPRLPATSLKLILTRERTKALNNIPDSSDENPIGKPDEGQ